MHKVYYKFEDGTRVSTLREAQEHRESSNQNWELEYEFVPMPVDAAEGGTPRNPLLARKPKGLRTTSLANIVHY